jgi:hypothetical protein
MVALIGFSIRSDLYGVSSFIRCLFLNTASYRGLLRFFNGTGVNLQYLTSSWITIVFRILSRFSVRINGRRVLIVDGLTNPKEGKKMPGVKLLHQDSNNNSKAEFVMAHACQCIALLVWGLGKYLSIPLAGRIHDGIKASPNDKKSIILKLIELIESLKFDSSYVVADAYYACRSMMSMLLLHGHHLITRMRSNSIAFLLPKLVEKKGPGRPKKFGDKVKLADLFTTHSAAFISSPSPFFDETGVFIRFYTDIFMIQASGLIVRIVLVVHPKKGKWILLSTDTTMQPIDIIMAYGARFRIEVMFRAAIYQLGVFSYHFWSMIMNRIKRGSGNQYLHAASQHYRDAMLSKLNTYNLYIQLGLIAQGMLLSLSLLYPKEIWANRSFWIRTADENSNPSEAIVADALRSRFFEFIADSAKGSILQKFLRKIFDINRISLKTNSFFSQILKCKSA